MEYELELINVSRYGVISHKTYQVKNYDGDLDKLKEYVKQLNEKSLFNIDWYIKNEEKGILEETIETLD